uniref:Ribonuclease n=1 Tax=Myxobolus squamalis TaxID=59785 RepID=A0A6B2FZX8_MYXSQ
MLICAFFCRKDDENILREIGCKDSKTMTPKRRERIFEEICAHPKLGFTAKAISPHFISHSAFQKPKYNLNTMSIDTGVELTQNPKHALIDSIFADMIGNNLVYENELKLNFPKSNIVVQPKADSKYLVVGAASICAKVIRDHILTNWRFPENINNRNFGSGYTSDKITIDWLNDVIDPQTGFPNIVRYSWSTCKKIIANKAPLLIRKSDATLVKPHTSRKRKNTSSTPENQKLKFKSID